MKYIIVNDSSNEDAETTVEFKLQRSYFHKNNEECLSLAVRCGVTNRWIDMLFLSEDGKFNLNGSNEWKDIGFDVCKLNDRYPAVRDYNGYVLQR